MKPMEQRGMSLLAGLFLVGAGALFFGPVLLSGRGLYGGDFVLQFYPWKHFVYEQVRQEGSLPFWNPFLFSGTPFVTNIQASMFYPLGILYYLLPPVPAYSLSTFLHCLLGGAGMLSFMNALSVRTEGRILSAVTFTFSGFFMAHLFAGHLSFIQTYVWIPWVFLWVYRFGESGELRHACAAGLVLGVQILGGFPQVAFYTILSVMVYAAFAAGEFLKQGHARRSAKVALGTALVLAIGFALAAVQVLPTLEFTGLSTRGGGVSYAMASYDSLHPEEFLAFLLPDIFGNAVNGTYWRSRDAWHFWETCGYVGILPLMLAFVRLESRGHRRAKRFFLFLVLLSLFLALGGHNPLYPLVARLPGFRSFRIPAQILFLYVFGVSALAGLGMHGAGGKDWRWNRAWVTFFAAAALLFTLCLVGIHGFRFPFFFHLFRQFALDPVDPATLTGLFERTRDSVHRGACFFVLAVLFLILVRRGRLRYSMFGWLAATLVFADLYLFGASFVQPWKPGPDRPRKAAISTLSRSPVQGRVQTVDPLFHPNDGLLYGFPSMGGYDPLILRRYVRFIQASNGERPDDHVVLLQGVRAPLEKRARLLRIKAVFTESGLHLHEPSLPYAHIVHKALFMKPEAGLAYMGSEDFDPETEVLLEPEAQGQETSQAAKAPSGEGDSCDILDCGLEHIHLRARCEQAGYLVLSEIHYPGWQAEVNGLRAPVLRGNYLFRVIPLPAGEHDVRLTFVSWPFRAGAVISVVTLILAVAFFFLAVGRGRSRRWAGAGGEVLEHGDEEVDVGKKG